MGARVENGVAAAAPFLFVLKMQVSKIKEII
jgi:hypothetical protein